MQTHVRLASTRKLGTQVAYGVPVEPGFVPGPMQQGAAYAAEAAMQRPVKRPITIQAPSDQQQTTAAFPPPQVAHRKTPPCHRNVICGLLLCWVASKPGVQATLLIQGT